MAKRSETSCKGASIAVNVIIISTRAADGTGADENDAAKDVKVTVAISANPSFIPDICEVKALKSKELRITSTFGKK